MPVKVLLQEVRKSRGLSQNDLARLIQMSPQNIQKIEQGDAKSLTFVTLGRLCKALNCQPGDLLIYEDDPDNGEDQTTNQSEQLDVSSELIENQSSQQRRRSSASIAVIPGLAESA